jgi:hypothetical protein
MGDVAESLLSEADQTAFLQGFSFRLSKAGRELLGGSPDLGMKRRHEQKE